MCLAALGTQTGGSLLRPAAYTGIVGFKPTYGYISADGVMPNSWSFDTVGVHARCVADVEVLWQSLKEETPLSFARIPLARHIPARRGPNDSPRLGYFRDFFEKETSEDVLENLMWAMEAFKDAGAEILELKLPEDFSVLIDGWSIIKGAELAAYHRPLFDERGDQFPPKIKDRIEKGFTVPAYQYVDAVRSRLVFQEKMSTILSSVDAAIMPIASTTAPEGLATTGSSIFNRPWTFTGFPAMSIPSGLDAAGLPFAIQMAALPMAELQLMSVTGWCERILGFEQSPA
jgi:Asp-tRNA(Asn)/Glu-tRNA(Gln) amidotransferase A subunit family amidase